MFTIGPASEIHNSSDGCSIRSIRERPPIGNITISRGPDAETHPDEGMRHLMQQHAGEQTHQEQCIAGAGLLTAQVGDDQENH